MELTRRDRATFVQALLKPAARPNEKLRKAVNNKTRRGRDGEATIQRSFSSRPAKSI